MAERIDDAEVASRGLASVIAGMVHGPCSMDIGCDEAGVCFAAANGQPDRCPAHTIEIFLEVAELVDGAFAVIAIDPSNRVEGGCSAIVQSIHSTRAGADIALAKARGEA